MYLCIDQKVDDVYAFVDGYDAHDAVDVKQGDAAFAPFKEKMNIINGSPAKACGLTIDPRKSKQEESSVNDASELRSELFDFSIEGFGGSIGRTVDKIV